MTKSKKYRVQFTTVAYIVGYKDIEAMDEKDARFEAIDTELGDIIWEYDGLCEDDPSSLTINVREI